jgi:hypothetical protein
MKRRWIVCGLLIGCCAGPLAGARSQEIGPRKEGPATLPAPPTEALPAPTPIGPSCAPPGRTLSLPRMTLMEVQEATTIPRLNLREEVVGKACGLDVEYKEEKQIVTEWALKPREVVKEVLCTRMVPVTIVDCTGHPHTEYRSEPIVRAVKLVVYDAVPVERVVVVAVPCLKPGKPLLVKKLVVDTTMEPAICTRLQLLTMPNQVQVPVCPCPIPHP